MEGYKVLGYFIDRLEEGEEVSSYNVFVAIDEGYRGKLTYYCPIGQHSEGVREYIDDCTPITKEEYLRVSGHLYTPKDYLQ